MTTNVDGYTPLYEALAHYFNLDELRSLCFDLQVEYENLPGERTRIGLARELTRLMARQVRTAALLTRVQMLRPQVDWQRYQPAEPEAQSPYKGLQFFEEADAPLFFGREQVTAELVEHLRQHRFLAVVGASGSGKSSLVRAGVVTAVRRGAIVLDNGSSANWPIHVITPGDEPLKALAASLTRASESVTATKTLLADLRADSDSLDLFLARQVQAGRLLLLVDQFEELFTQCHDTAARQLFVDGLVTAVSGDRQGRFSLILTLRADFYAFAVQLESLRPLLETRQKIIGAMSQAELRQAIEGPADKGKWHFQPGLVETMLQDVGREPGALPLLSHALQETWARREGRALTLAGYQAAGGVRRAIAQTADAVYAGLTPEQQAIARNIFLRLTELGEGTEDTRRRASLVELLPQGEGETAVQNVLDLLARRRLLTLSEETAQPYAEVSHEALIREWPALRAWLDENRAGLRVQRQVTEAAQAWQANGEDASYLYRGGRLAQAQEWAVGHAQDLNSMEHTFLLTSQEHEVNEQARIRAIAIERTRASRFLNAALFVANIFAIAFLIISLQNRANLATTGAQTRIAQSQALASASLAVQEKDLMPGLLLAVAAGQTTETALAYEALHRAIPRTARPLHTLQHDGRVNGMIWNGDESLILSWSTDGTARLWEVASGAERLRLSHDSWVGGAAWNGDESLILTWSLDGTARLWEAASGAILFTLTGDGSSVVTGAWSQDERQIWLVTSGGFGGIFYTRMADLLTAACQHTIRNLTWTEWQLYFPGRPYRVICEQWPVHPSVPPQQR